MNGARHNQHATNHSVKRKGQPIAAVAVSEDNPRQYLHFPYRLRIYGCTGAHRNISKTLDAVHKVPRGIEAHTPPRQHQPRNTFPPAAFPASLRQACREAYLDPAVSPFFCFRGTCFRYPCHLPCMEIEAHAAPQHQLSYTALPASGSVNGTALRSNSAAPRPTSCGIPKAYLHSTSQGGKVLRISPLCCKTTRSTHRAKGTRCDEQQQEDSENIKTS